VQKTRRRLRQEDNVPKIPRSLTPLRGHSFALVLPSTFTRHFLPKPCEYYKMASGGRMNKYHFDVRFGRRRHNGLGALAILTRERTNIKDARCQPKNETEEVGPLRWSDDTPTQKTVTVHGNTSPKIQEQSHDRKHLRVLQTISPQKKRDDKHYGRLTWLTHHHASDMTEGAAQPHAEACIFL